MCEWIARRPDANLSLAWECACGGGHLVRGLADYFHDVIASDLHHTGFGTGGVDFLAVDEDEVNVPWIITNPPFGKMFFPFVEHALGIATQGVAMFGRTAVVEGTGRWRKLWTPYPPTAILQFAERVPIEKGRVNPEGSTATAYAWFVWTEPLPGHTLFEWIPPCRERLEKETDYD